MTYERLIAKYDSHVLEVGVAMTYKCFDLEYKFESI